MAAAIRALVKPELLLWARDRAKVTIEDAAKAAGVSVERLETWENIGGEAPTLAQLRCLASKYHFPLAVFYLPEPPVDFAALRDFRRLPDFEGATISPALAFQIRNAHERREVALELNDELRDEPQTFVLKATLEDDPEEAGQKIRAVLGIDDAQKRAARSGRAFDFWRRKMEEHDILVFVVSGPHYGIELREMRGFAIAKEKLPVIVVNAKDYSQGGKAFTLLHELVHILLGESAISNGSTDSLSDTTEEQRIERFCDAVAAAALMPRRMLQSFANVEKSSTREWSDDELRKIAQAVGVSRHALLRRLVTLKRATWAYYQTQKARFDEEARRAAEKAAQKPKKEVAIKPPVLVMSRKGRGYTRIVFRSYYDQRITLNDVSSYLGAKVKYIAALERAAFQMTE